MFFLAKKKENGGIRYTVIEHYPIPNSMGKDGGC